MEEDLHPLAHLSWDPFRCLRPTTGLSRSERYFGLQPALSCRWLKLSRERGDPLCHTLPTEEKESERRNFVSVRNAAPCSLRVSRSLRHTSNLVHAAFLLDDFTTASMNAMPRTASSTFG